MKTRNGFVSNSSSSSFIISVNKTDECPHCKRKDPNFLDFMKHMSDNCISDDTAVRALGFYEVIEWVKQYYGYKHDYCDKKWVDSILEKVKEFENNGKEIGVISISYHDKIANDEFLQQIKNSSVEKIPVES